MRTRVPLPAPAASRRASPRIGLALLLVLLLVAPGCDKDGMRTWSDGAVDRAASIPVLSEGRVKPLHSYASFLLLRLNHRKSSKDAVEDGRTLGPVEWLLDVLLRPEAARTYPCFRVDDAQVVEAIGLDPSKMGKKKADRYTFDELAPGMQRLLSLGEQLSKIEDKQRDAVQSALVALAHNASEFDWLTHFLDFAREGDFRVNGSPLLLEVFGGRETAPFSEIVAQAPRLGVSERMARLRAQEGEHESGPQFTADDRAIFQLLHRAEAVADLARTLTLFPPDAPVAEREDWYTVSEIFHNSVDGRVSPVHVEMLAALEAMNAAATHEPMDHAAFEKALGAFSERSERLAQRRGQYGKVGLEVYLQRKLDPFGRSLLLYILAFFLVAVTWLAPNVRWVRWGAWGLLGAAVTLHVTGIVLRCILRGRPPVLNLYDTVLFITALGALTGMVVEWLTRMRVALALAPLAGAVGLFVANRFEVTTGRDTIEQLQAVLDTNFWLATHVTCISTGYMAALVASLFAHVAVLGRAFGLKQGDARFYGSLNRMIYGVLGFGLIFAVVGTILGGIWANDSWGRFWGWDPKENGALMIVLAELAILHGRMGGFLRPHGIAMSTVFLGCIVAFSWWGVNLLGIGLHTYGFASGVFKGLMIFYAVEAAVLATGALWWLTHRPGAARPS